MFSGYSCHDVSFPERRSSNNSHQSLFIQPATAKKKSATEVKYESPQDTESAGQTIFRRVKGLGWSGQFALSNSVYITDRSCFLFGQSFDYVSVLGLFPLHTAGPILRIPYLGHNALSIRSGYYADKIDRVRRKG